MHSIYYIASPLSHIRLDYKVIPTPVEYVRFNTSINIKHLTGTFQRNIEIDATQQPVAIQLSERNFTGYTDSCKYGGIRMYHRLSMAVQPDYLHRSVVEARVPYDSKEHSQSMIKLNRRDEFLRACTNDSIIFKNLFHLDFGITNIILYGYNSMFQIDLNFTVYPSIYISAFNFERRYCGKLINIYIFKSYIINCFMQAIQLTQQIRFSLQWSGDGVARRDKTEWIWPGRMTMTVNCSYLPYHAVRQINGPGISCNVSNKLRITALHKNTKIILTAARKVIHHTVHDTESLNIERRTDDCRFIARVQYRVYLDPVPGGNRCPKTQTDFTSATRLKYRQMSKSCVLIDLIFSRGDHIVYVSGALYRYPQRNSWIYFYLHISQQCDRSTEILVYYTTEMALRQSTDHYQFTPGKSKFVFYDFGVFRVLQFYLRRRSWVCTAFFQMTEVQQFTPVFYNFSNKVC